MEQFCLLAEHAAQLAFGAFFIQPQGHGFPRKDKKDKRATWPNACFSIDHWVHVLIWCLSSKAADSYFLLSSHCGCMLYEEVDGSLETATCMYKKHREKEHF